jgi:hypothetical protein
MKLVYNIRNRVRPHVYFPELLNRFRLNLVCYIDYSLDSCHSYLRDSDTELLPFSEKYLILWEDNIKTSVQ